MSNRDWIRERRRIWAVGDCTYLEHILEASVEIVIMGPLERKAEVF